MYMKEQFMIMQEFMQHKLYQMGEEIVSGHIEKQPYTRKNQEEQCQISCREG